MGCDHNGVVVLHHTIFRVNRRHDVRYLRSFRSSCSLKTKKNIICRHLFPIVELHIVSKLKSPSQIVDPLPFGRKTRHNFTVIVIFYKRLVYRIQIIDRRIDRRRMRI